MRSGILKLLIRLQQAFKRLSSFFTPAVKVPMGMSESLAAFKPFCRPEDFKNNKILIINAAQGALVFQALAWGASEAIGIIDNQDDFWAAQNAAQKTNAEDRARFIYDDPARPAFWLGCPRADTAVIVASNCNSVSISRIARFVSAAYVHCEQTESHVDIISTIFESGVWHQAECLNCSPSLIRCSNEIKSKKEAADIIRNIMQEDTIHKIAVVGKGGSGKSYIKKIIERCGLPDNGYKLIDDNHDTQYLNSLESLYYLITGLWNMCLILKRSFLSVQTKNCGVTYCFQAD